MKEERCQSCGASMKVWKHSLSRGLVDALTKFMGAVKLKNRNSIHLQKDIDFTKNQYNNFQKLHYFGLVDKDKHRTGCWVVTELGGKFLRNEITIPMKALSFRDKLVDREGKEVRITDYMKGREEDYWEKEFDFNFAQQTLI